jgi:glycosyltransferase involved in cell wall biosynthesis/Flp pilus assembly protein TadD
VRQVTQHDKQLKARPLKVVHLATTDFGGAGKAAYRLHTGLRESGVDSTMLVVNRKNLDPSVRILPSGPVGGIIDCPEQYPPNQEYAHRIWQHWTENVSHYPERAPGMEIFSDDYSELGLECSREIQQADIVNLHWVAGMVNWVNATRALRGKKVVWTMHDMNPATGGCHYSGACTRYRESCGACPMLGSQETDDLSRTVWQYKRFGYGKLDITPVSPSRWLAGVAQQSSLLSPFQARVIPNGFPTEMFRPSPRREQVRDGYGVPKGAKVVLFGAESLLTERKGFVFLLHALKAMAGDGIVFAFFGKIPPEVELQLNLPLINVGFIEDEKTLAEVYSMADLFVIPSIEDNLPNTVVEAMLCGVPVVGFDIGGIPDMVEHKKTGFLVAPRDVAGLVEGIRWCLFHPEAEKLGANSRAKAEKFYSLEAQAASYSALYRELLAEKTAPAPAPLPPVGQPAGASPACHPAPASPPESYLVSAIVSSYDAERFLRGKLEDLEAQTIADRLEIIVIDSASPGNEGAIVAEFQKRYDNIRYLRTDRRETVYQAWNRGIRMANGEFVTNANTDDRLRSDCYETLVRALREHPECVLAYPDMRITEQENATFEEHRPLGTRDWPPFDRLALMELCCVGPFPLWRRSLHEEIGYFDERYRSAADYEFWLRAAERHPFIHVPQFLGLYWLSEQTVSRRGELPTLEYLQVQKQYRPRFARFAPPPAPLGPEEQGRFQESLQRIGSLEAAPQASAAPPGIQGLIEELERFCGEHPGFPAAHHELARLYYRKGEVGHAKKFFEKAVLLDPAAQEYADSLEGFFRVELYRSLQYYTAELAAHPDDLESRLSAGMLCILLARHEAARDHYLKALELDPDHAPARGNLAALAHAAAGSVPVGTAVTPLTTTLSHALAGAARLCGEAPAAPDAGCGSGRAQQQDCGQAPVVSIVIPLPGEPERLGECLESIARHTPEQHEVILVHDGAAEQPAWLTACCERDGRHRLAQCTGGAGFAAAANAGLSLARGTRVLLMSSDTVLTKGWLRGLATCLEREPDAAFAGPVSNGLSGAQRLPGTSYRSSEELEQFAARFTRENGGRRVAVERLDGSCLFFERSRLPEIGAFDESFGSVAVAVADLCLRAALAGRGCQIAADVFIHHHGSRGAVTAYATWEPQDRERYDAKWELSRLDDALARQLATRNAIILGRRLARQEQLDQAVDVLLKQGILFSPQSCEPYRALARVLADAGQYRDALEVLEQLPAAPEPADLVLSGECHLGLGQAELARELAEKALDRQPEAAQALTLKGTLVCGTGDRARAQELFRVAAAADPGYGPALTALSRLAGAAGDPQQALALAERGFVLAPLARDALQRLHECALLCDALPLEAGRLGEARALFPDSRVLAFGAIELALAVGDYRQAMEQIEQAGCDFGMDDAMIDAALSVRQRIAPRDPGAGAGLLSLCLIVKDEAHNLPALFNSVRSLVDEIVVADTGSSDRSADLARIYGARVFDFPWTGSFAEARNYSLSQARCRWILVLDADELLAPGDLPPLRALLERSQTPTAFSFTTRNYTSEITRKNWSANRGEYPAQEKGSGWTPSEKVRLFPNDRRLAFQGTVHELVEASLVACGIPIHACDVPVHHYGRLDRERSLAKQQTYYRLGLKKLAETGADAGSLLELARQATELGLAQEAQELWLKLLQLEPQSGEAHFNLGYLHLTGGDYARARLHAELAVRLAPEMKEAAFNLAKCLLVSGEPHPALDSSQELLRRWPDYPPALSLYCACCLVLELTGEAEATLDQLARRGFDCADFLNEYAQGLLKGPRSDLAAPLLGRVALAAQPLATGGRHAPL